MSSLPGPEDPSATPAAHLAELTLLIGSDACVDACVALLGGADARAHADVVCYLGGVPARAVLAGTWAPYWPRVWGGRGLLYVWADRAGPAVVEGLDDEAWRVAEMCLKVGARHEVPGVGDGAARLAEHPLERVRAAAMRALAVAGDTEHLWAVERGLEDPHALVRRSAATAWARLAERLDLTPPEDEPRFPR